MNDPLEWIKKLRLGLLQPEEPKVVNPAVQSPAPPVKENALMASATVNPVYGQFVSSDPTKNISSNRANTFVNVWNTLLGKGRYQFDQLMAIQNDNLGAKQSLQSVLNEGVMGLQGAAGPDTPLNVWANFTSFLGNEAVHNPDGSETLPPNPWGETTFVNIAQFLTKMQDLAKNGAKWDAELLPIADVMPLSQIAVPVVQETLKPFLTI
jgi:hypothetical protein